MTLSPRSQLRRSAPSSSAKQTRSRFAPRPFTDETDTAETDSPSPDRTDAPPTVQARSPLPLVNLLTIPTHAPTPAPVQAKLTIGEPGDQYEQEADRTAAEVMRMPEPPVQREPLSEEEEAIQTKPIAISAVNGASLQQKCSECEQDVQRSSEGTAEAGSDIKSQLNSSKGGGSPLSDEVRSFMEPRFGADFSSVRTHTGGAAVQMSEAIGAQAFTHGSDIYFGAGKSPANSDLTAHELTHVVQQSGGVQAQTVQRQSRTHQEASKDFIQRDPADSLDVEHNPDASTILSQLNPPVMKSLGEYCNTNCPATAAAVSHYLTTGEIKAAHCNKLAEDQGYDVSENEFTKSATWKQAIELINKRTSKHGSFVVVEGDRGEKPPEGLTRWHYFTILNIRGKRFVVDAFGSGQITSNISSYVGSLGTKSYKLVKGEFKVKPMRKQ